MRRASPNGCDENFKNRKNIAKNAENERKYRILEKLFAAEV